MSYLPSCPGPTNLPDVFQKYPERSMLMSHPIDDILRGDSPLTVAERELLPTIGYRGLAERLAAMADK